MYMYVGETLVDSPAGATRSHGWMRRVIALLDTAARQLDHEQVAHRTIVKAASLLRKQIDPELAEGAAASSGGLPTRHAHKVCAYIDSHITDRVLVADLCALVQLSQAHFSRAFRRTFGKSPHAFVIWRRVELAAQYMLQTEAPLSDIALQCGFTDQPHLCKHFRQATGYTPAAWRRAHSGGGDADQHGTARGVAIDPAKCGPAFVSIVGADGFNRNIPAMRNPGQADTIEELTNRKDLMWKLDWTALPQLAR
jgi:AraC family transcriptional regulator